MSTTDTATDAAAGAAHEVAKSGMPQLDFSTFPNQIFWLVLTLVVIYFVLSRVALPRIGGTLANRKASIRADLAAAEEMKQKAMASEKAYDDALVAARAEAAKIVAAAKADIQADLNKAIARRMPRLPSRRRNRPRPSKRSAPVLRQPWNSWPRTLRASWLRPLVARRMPRPLRQRLPHG